MLTVAGLSKSSGGRELFDDVSFTIQSGERIAITGHRLLVTVGGSRSDWLLD